MITSRRSRRHRVLGAAATCVFVAGACTGDDDDAGTAGDTAETEATAAESTESAEATSTAEDTGAATTTIGGATTPATTAPDDTAVTVAQTGGKLAAVQEAGVLRCGGRDDVPGFNVLDPAGEHVGFDADFCGVIAAAVLGDATAIEIVDLDAADRFTALQSGEIDVLVRNTTWTASRDGGEGATFLTTTFYDGQGMMVASDSGFTSLTDMTDAVICVTQGTTTEGNVVTEGARLGLNWEVAAFEDPELIQQAFEAGQCDGWSSDTSQLTGLRSVYPAGPEALTILPEVFSKEPLAPAVADGDTEWAQAVNWAILATIQAEEFGITSENVDTFSTSEDLGILRFLGLEVPGDDGAAVLDPGLGLPTDFALQVVSQVGNYAEIFDRHLTPLGLERGVNALWTDGGLLYAPPYR